MTSLVSLGITLGIAMIIVGIIIEIAAFIVGEVLVRIDMKSREKGVKDFLKKEKDFNTYLELLKLFS